MSDPIPTFDIQIPVLKSSIGITSMNWNQAQSERWCISPINNVKPNLAMLSKEGYTVPKNIYDDPWNLLKSKGERHKEKFHSCFITFDRSYVVWWYANALSGLVEDDPSLLYDITLMCSGKDLSGVKSLPLKGLTIKDLRPIVDELGYRLHKKEASRIRLKESASFKIT